MKRLEFIFAGDKAAVRIIGVSVIARCPQGESVDCIIFLDILLCKTVLKTVY